MSVDIDCDLIIEHHSVSVNCVHSKIRRAAQKLPRPKLMLKPLALVYIYLSIKYIYYVYT